MRKCGWLIGLLWLAACMDKPVLPDYTSYETLILPEWTCRVDTVVNDSVCRLSVGMLFAGNRPVDSIALLVERSGKREDTLRYVWQPDEDAVLHIVLKGLESGQRYRCRVALADHQYPICSDTAEFTTPNSYALTVSMMVRDYWMCNLYVGGNFPPGDSVYYGGCVWADHPEPTLEDHVHEIAFGVTEREPLFYLSITKNSFVRCFARNSTGVFYGEVVYWQTQVSLPRVSVSPVSTVSDTAAYSGFLILGGDEITGTGNNVYAGLCWSLNPHPTVEDDTVEIQAQRVAGCLPLSGLKPATTYYVRSYLRNSRGLAYSEEEYRFTTRAKGVPATSPWRKLTQLSQVDKWAHILKVGDKVYALSDGWKAYDLPYEPMQFWEFDLKQDKWTRLADYPGTSLYSTCAFEADGVIYYGFGYVETDSVSNVSGEWWRYDPTVARWSRCVDIYETHPNGIIGVVAGGQILLVDSEAIWRYLPASDTYELTAMPSLWEYMNGSQAFSVDGRLFVEGSYSINEYIAEEALWESCVAPPLGIHTGSRLLRYGNRIFYFGGRCLNDTGLDGCTTHLYEFDYRNFRFIRCADLPANAVFTANSPATALTGNIVSNNNELWEYLPDYDGESELMP